MAAACVETSGKSPIRQTLVGLDDPDKDGSVVTRRHCDQPA